MRVPAIDLLREVLCNGMLRCLGRGAGAKCSSVTVYNRWNQWRKKQIYLVNQLIQIWIIVGLMV